MVNKTNIGILKLPSLNGIVSGATMIVIFKLFSMGVSYITMVILARWLGPTEFGVYSYSLTFVSFIYVLGNLGMENVLLRELPKAISRRVRHSIAWSALPNLLFTTAILVPVLMITSPLMNRNLHYNGLVTFLAFMLLSLPCQALIMFSRVANQTKYHFIKAYIPENVVRPICFLLPIIYAPTVAAHNRPLLCSIYLIISYVVALTLGMWFSSDTWLNSRPVLNKESSIAFAKSGVPYLITDVLTSVSPFILTTIMACFLSAANIGYFRAPLQTASLVTVALQSVNMVFAPVFSRLYFEGSLDHLNLAYKQATKWVLVSGGFLTVFIVVCSKDILRLFGAHFVDQYVVLQIICLGQLVNVATGPCDYLLQMTKYKTTVSKVSAIEVVLTAVVSVVLVPFYGLVGAAITFASVKALKNIVYVFVCTTELSAHPLSRTYWVVIASLTMSFVVSIMMHTVFDNLHLLIRLFATLGVVIATLFVSFPFWGELNRRTLLLDPPGEGRQNV